jgi:hypothetical protein
MPADRPVTKSEKIRSLPRRVYGRPNLAERLNPRQQEDEWTRLRFALVSKSTKQ